MPENSPEQQNVPERARATKIVFFTLVLELAGFSIIFPLFPAILDFYLPLEGEGGNGLLSQWIAFLQNINPAEDPTPWMTAVLFGGTLASLYGILQFIASPILGSLSDRFGRRRLLLFTLAGTAVSYLIWVFSGSFLLLVLSRLLGGLMAGNIAVATAAMADLTPSEKRSKGMALVGVAFGFGFIVGPLLGGFTAQFDLTERFPQLVAIGLNPFSVAALASLALTMVNLFWVWKFFPETMNLREPEKDQRVAVPRLGRADSPEIDRANLTYFFFILGFSGLEFTITFLAVERFGFSPWQNGLLFLYIGFLLILVQGGFVRRVGPKLGEKKMALFGIFAAFLSLIMMGLAVTVGQLLIGLAFLSVGVGLTNPSLSALVSRYSSPSRQGYNLGLFRALSSLGRSIGPIIAGVLYFTFGAQNTYFVGAGLMVLPLLMLFTLPQPEVKGVGREKGENLNSKW